MSSFDLYSFVVCDYEPHQHLMDKGRWVIAVTRNMFSHDFGMVLIEIFDNNSPVHVT